MPVEDRKPQDRLISHRRRTTPLATVVEAVRQRIIGEGDKPHVSVNEQLALLEELTQLALGRFLLENQGIDGYWTHYVIYIHSEHGRKAGHGDVRQPRSTLEHFLLDRAPTFLASRERLGHFQRVMQDALREKAKQGEVVLASLPCGVMADVLTLNFAGVSQFRLVGIDLDADALRCAREFAEQLKLSAWAEFYQEDAWELTQSGAFDALCSNGLNIYEPDDEKVTQLYRNFFRALKPDGLLVTCSLTPPPGVNLRSEWDMTCIDESDLLRQRIVLSDIVGVKWECFRSSELSRRQLERAGFSDVRIIPDRAHMFPTITARKSRA